MMILVSAPMAVIQAGQETNVIVSCHLNVHGLCSLVVL